MFESLFDKVAGIPERWTQDPEVGPYGETLRWDRRVGR